MIRESIKIQAYIPLDSSCEIWKHPITKSFDCQSENAGVKALGCVVYGWDPNTQGHTGWWWMNRKVVSAIQSWLDPIPWIGLISFLYQCHSPNLYGMKEWCRTLLELDAFDQLTLKCQLPACQGTPGLPGATQTFNVKMWGRREEKGAGILSAERSLKPCPIKASFAPVWRPRSVSRTPRLPWCVM